MDIPGIDTILFQPAKAVWPGERAPSAEFARLFDEIPHKLELGQFDEVAAQLDQIARCELEPSQTMRLHFLQGQLFSDMQEYDYGQAYQFYGHALDIAEDHGDLDAQITLIDLSGLMMYGLMRNREATILYQQALALWRERALQLPKPRAEPEVKFLERIGATQWNTGDFDPARANLARCLTLALYKRGIPHTDFIRGRTARALWMLGLTLRSQSDMRDGSLSLLRTALKRMKQAVSQFEVIGADDAAMGRLYVQIAEVYLDLAELRLQYEADDEAHAMRSKALTYTQEAAGLLRRTENQAGKLLPELTLLRHEITRRLDTDAVPEMREFEAKLSGIEYEAGEIGDHVISAKAATLRGEWCLWFGQPEPAREALILALTGFQQDNMGMATRAQRLLRRANEPIRQRPLKRRRRSSGPIARPEGSDAQA